MSNTPLTSEQVWERTYRDLYGHILGQGKWLERPELRVNKKSKAEEASQWMSQNSLTWLPYTEYIESTALNVHLKMCVLHQPFLVVPMRNNIFFYTLPPTVILTIDIKYLQSWHCSFSLMDTTTRRSQNDFPQLICRYSTNFSSPTGLKPSSLSFLFLFPRYLTLVSAFW